MYNNNNFTLKTNARLVVTVHYYRFNKTQTFKSYWNIIL